MIFAGLGVILIYYALWCEWKTMKNEGYMNFDMIMLSCVMFMACVAIIIIDCVSKVF